MVGGRGGGKREGESRVVGRVRVIEGVLRGLKGGMWGEMSYSGVRELYYFPQWRLGAYAVRTRHGADGSTRRLA